MGGASEPETGPHPDEALRARPTSPVLRSGEVAGAARAAGQQRPLPSDLYHDQWITRR